LSDYVLAAGRLVRDIPNLYACICGPRAGLVPYLVQTAGADKVIFGSDFGFTDWTILAEFLDNVRESSVDRETLKRVLYKNAARLLRLEERPLRIAQAT
jgi:predicted TIM-barrel fold metal-dependent hydrolase